MTSRRFAAGIPASVTSALVTTETLIDLASTPANRVFALPIKLVACLSISIYRAAAAIILFPLIRPVVAMIICRRAIDSTVSIRNHNHRIRVATFFFLPNES